MKHKILVCGASGSGKSTSLRNLDPKNTTILNTERKVLPFRSAKQFDSTISIDSYDAYVATLNKIIAKGTREVIVIDSFTSLSEQVSQFCTKNWKNYDIYKNYQILMYELVQNIKSIDRHVIITGIDEPIQDDTGVITRHLRVEGKALKGAIEKEFAIVLWSKTIKEDGVIKHVFETNNDGSTTAKTPMEMFSDRFIDNDIAAVLAAINEYYL